MTKIEFYGWEIGMRLIPFSKLLTTKTDLGLKNAYQIGIKILDGEIIEISIESMELAEEIVSKSLEVGVKARIKEE